MLLPTGCYVNFALALRLVVARVGFTGADFDPTTEKATDMGVRMLGRHRHRFLDVSGFDEEKRPDLLGQLTVGSSADYGGLPTPLLASVGRMLRQIDGSESAP